MITPELIEYINRSRQAGYSKEDIKRVLIAEGGWSPEDVEEAFGRIEKNDGMDSRAARSAKRPRTSPEAEPAQKTSGAAAVNRSDTQESVFSHEEGEKDTQEYILYGNNVADTADARSQDGTIKESAGHTVSRRIGLLVGVFTAFLIAGAAAGYFVVFQSELFQESVPHPSELIRRAGEAMQGVSSRVIDTDFKLSGSNIESVVGTLVKTEVLSGEVTFRSHSEYDMIKNVWSGDMQTQVYTSVLGADRKKQLEYSIEGRLVDDNVLVRINNVYVATTSEQTGLLSGVDVLFGRWIVIPANTSTTTSMQERQTYVMRSFADEYNDFLALLDTRATVNNAVRDGKKVYVMNVHFTQEDWRNIAQGFQQGVYDFLEQLAQEDNMTLERLGVSRSEVEDALRNWEELQRGMHDETAQQTKEKIFALLGHTAIELVFERGTFYLTEIHMLGELDDELSDGSVMTINMALNTRIRYNQQIHVEKPEGAITIEEAMKWLFQEYYLQQLRSASTTPTNIHR